MKILIVENDEVVTRLWARWFSSRSHIVKVALSVKQALDSIKEDVPNLILLDLRLNGPTNSGLTVYDHIRTTLGEGIPIIFVTGLEYNVDLFKQAELKVDIDAKKGYLTQMVQKPISIRELDRIVVEAA